MSNILQNLDEYVGTLDKIQDEELAARYVKADEARAWANTLWQELCGEIKRYELLAFDAEKALDALEKVYAKSITMNNHSHRQWLAGIIERLRGSLEPVRNEETQE